MWQEEEEFFQIDFFDSIYTYNLYGRIIPQISEYYRNHHRKALVFNFADLNFLAPDVVPNILNIADIYRRYTRRNILLRLSWNPTLLSYLCSVRFFEYADDLNLFEYNHDMLVGIDSYSTHDNRRMIFSDANSSEDKIKSKITKMMRPMTVYLERGKYSAHDYQDDYDMISEIFFHLIHNANDPERGNSNAYALFEINSYAAHKYVAYLSICDGGKGIAKTISEKVKNGKAKNLLVDSNHGSTFDYILEALFWRKWVIAYPFRHGLYDVARMVLKKRGKMGVHSQNTRVMFADDFQDLFFAINSNIDEIMEKKTMGLDSELRSEIDDYAKHNTSTRRYRGVHIDIEIPLGGRK